MSKQLTKSEEIKKEEKYLDFLKKAIASKNFKKLDPKRYEKALKDYDKVKFRLKILKG